MLSSYYVGHTEASRTGVRYVVKRYQPYQEVDDDVASFETRRECGAYSWSWEQDWSVRARAHEFADLLNAGGARAERALREAQG